MFNSKYSKLLTGLLVASIVIIIGILIYVGIDWYKTYTTEADVQDGLDKFDGYVNNTISNSQANTNTNEETNTNTNAETNNIEVVDPDINVNNTIQNVTSSGNSGNSGTSSSNKKPTYKGFNMVGKIEIPKINLSYPVLEKATPRSIEVAVAVQYGPGINKVGNTVIIGHNYRNGTFFSNNKKLAEGDKIYLTDLEGKKVTYTIYKKYLTDTGDADYYVRDTKGKREISLSTCTDDSKQRLVIWAKEN